MFVWSSYSSIVNSICPGSAPPPLDDSGSSFTDLRVVYHLIIIALSHYFLCCILWALLLNQALNHYYILFSYILFSLSHIIFAVQPNSYQPCGTHKSFYQINEQKRNILLLLFLLLCRNCPTIIVSLLIHIL